MSTNAADDGKFAAAADCVPQDWPRLAGYLAVRGHALDLASPPRQFAKGLANLKYLITIDGEPWVLRRPPAGPLPPGAYDMRREFTVLRQLDGHYRYAPRALDLCLEPEVLGAPFLIMEYRPGLTISGRVPPQLSSREVGPRLSEMTIALLAELHGVDAEAAGLSGFGKPRGFLDRAVEGWAKRAAIATGDKPRPIIGDIVAWLRARKVADGPPTLLHNDFKLDNMTLDPETLAPRAVLDWDQASRGDPLFDLATLISYWTEPGDPKALHDLGQMPTAEPGFADRAQALAHYARLTGRDVSNFRFYRALALFKLGVIFLQLFARYRDGGTADPRYASFEGVADGAFEYTLEVTRHRRD